MLLGPEAAVDTVVAQGCRPVGQPYVVTAVDGNHVVTLGGRPALERLEELAARRWTTTSASSCCGACTSGLVVDEQLDEFAQGDFLVRNVVERSRGRRCADGRRVPWSSGRRSSSRSATRSQPTPTSAPRSAGRSAAGSLLFTCTGRGHRLFGRPDHDATAVRDAFGAIPVAGGFCAGELGPVGGRNHVHGFTASLALFS